MSDYQSTATSTIYVNGKPAEDEIKRLRGEIDKYKKQLVDIAKDQTKGVNSDVWKKTRKELIETERELKRVNAGVTTIGQSMRRLDKATPNELRQALKQLNKELGNIERGSAAWNEHTKKIRAVKDELAKLNRETKSQESLWNRFAKKMFDWGAAIQTVAAAFTGITMSARSAVQAYADMDAEMASVRKFTGMSADEVARLNEEFKEIDTRTSREELNKLAQEAGRLGKSSQEDVLGFVRAANQINVALDDLGEGATLSLSKIAGAFGQEDKYGTEQALLKVGSVINELSQNCRASAPFLADFTNRLTGVGTTAGLTIQQIMGFGAVLDSNGAQLESSATALGQIVMKLYREPAKYAKAAGLEVEGFTKLLKEDANEAVLTFLEALRDAGNLDAMAPMLADMGEKGARSVATLTMLAGKIDEVRAQQKAANVAFDEGVSVTKEYEVQNNTVQAGLDKAKKNFHEMAISLGEKLAPAMKYAVTSSSALLKAISLLVTFINDHKKALANCIIVMTSYLVLVKSTTIAEKARAGVVALAKVAQVAFNAVVSVGTNIHKAYTYVVNLGRVAMILFRDGVASARIAFAALNATMKANVFGVLVTAITAVTLAIVNLTGKTDGYTKSVNAAIAQAKGFQAETVKEQHELDVLFGKLKGAEKGTKEYKSAKDTIINQYGKYLSGLIDEKGNILNLEGAYNRLTLAVRRSAQERGIAAAREKINNEYYSSTAGDLQQLQTVLEARGASPMEASEIVTQVAAAFSSGKPLSEGLIKKINSYSKKGVVKDNSGFGSWLTRPWRDTKVGDLFGWNGGNRQYPAEVVNSMFGKAETHRRGLSALDAMENGISPFRQIDNVYLEGTIGELEKIVKSGKAGNTLVFVEGSDQGTFREVSVSEAKKLLSQYREELAYRGGTSAAKPPAGTNYDNPQGWNLNTDRPTGGVARTTPVSPADEKKLEREAKKAEAERIKAARKAEAEKKKKERDAARESRLKERVAKQEYKEALDDVKAARDTEQAAALQSYRNGELAYDTYLSRLAEIDEDYWNARLDTHEAFGKEESDEYANDYKKLKEAVAKHEQELTNIQITALKQRSAEKKHAAEQEYYNPKNKTAYLNDNLLEDTKTRIDLTYLETVKALYTEGTKEWLDADQALKEAQRAEELRQIKKFEDDKSQWLLESTEKEAKRRLDIELKYVQQLKDAEKISEEQAAQWTAQLNKQYYESLDDKFFGLNADEKQKLYDNTKIILDALYEMELEKLGDNHEAKLELEKTYRKKLEEIRKGIFDDDDEENFSTDTDKKYQPKSWEQLASKWLDKAFGEGTWKKYGEFVKSGLSSISTMYQGLTTLVEAEEQKKLAAMTKKYDAEIKAAEGNQYRINQINKRKAEEEKRIKNAANKRAMAMEIAQAIASTALSALNAYKTAPAPVMIFGPIAAGLALAAGAIQIAAIRKQHQAQAEGYAEGGFTRPGGKYEPAGVVHAGEWVASQALLANPVARPMINMLDYAQRTNTIGRLSAGGAAAAPVVMTESAELRSVIVRLNERLNEPFVTVNTVTGDYGIKKALDEYNKLQNNTLPKNKRT